jgi:hypothetical protein
MKTALLAFFLIGTLAAVADDSTGNLLKNGDFSNGINEWHGNLHTPDAVSFADGETAPTSGVVVKLKGEWTQVEQDLTAGIGKYDVTINYEPSSDLKFSDKAEDYNNIPGQLGFNLLAPFAEAPGQWAVIINDLGAGHYNYWRLSPKVGAGPQSLHLHVQLDSDANGVKGFILAFPPGTGFINITSITLTPAK